MGADYTKELPASWDEVEVKDWKVKALVIMKSYYLGFGGCQWHEFDRWTDTKLLRAKICYALFGNPTEDASDIESAYNDNQRKKAGEILDAILQVSDESRVKALRVSFIFVACKQGESEFTLPVFSVFTGKDDKNVDRRQYVDTQCRKYKDWDDWKRNNNLPMMKYAYPRRGFYTCSKENEYAFDADKDPDVEFGTSPSCDASSRVLRQTDTATAVVSIGAGVVGVVGLFTPLAPAIAIGAAIAGGSSAVYGSARGISRLVDKGQHGQSLADLESLTIWFSLAATPLHFVSSAVNGTLAMGAQQGRIFSNSMRVFATVLNFTTLGVDGVMFAFGLGNLIQKAQKKELTALDVLQFSMSAFFFTNTLMQPKVASSIIRQAQEGHINRVMNSMTDAEAKASFQRFLDQNKGQGTITDTSKIIRTVNKMDANKFFGNVGADSKVEIGGRKGRTVLVSDKHGNTNRVNPNKVIFSKDSTIPGPVKFNRNFNKLEKCYGKNPNDVELNGKRIFDNLSDRQKQRIDRAFGGAAHFDKDVVMTAHSVAESMGFSTVDDLMSVLEIVVAEVGGKSGGDLTAALNGIRGFERNGFISGIRRDVVIATQCAERGGLKFENPLTAVYHYRKHGAEFPQMMKKFGSSIDAYLGPVSDKVFHHSNLRETCTLQNGIVKNTFTTSGDHFGVTLSTPDGVKISTMFRYPGKNQEFIENLTRYMENASGPTEPISDVYSRLARFLGFRGMQFMINIDGKPTPIDQLHDLDPVVHQEIARFLAGVEHCL